MSDLEAAFDTYWRVLGGPDLEREYRFDAEHRSRFDRAHPLARVAIGPGDAIKMPWLKARTGRWACSGTWIETWR